MTLLGFKEFYEIYSPKLGIGRDSLRKIVRKRFPKNPSREQGQDHWRGRWGLLP